MALIASWAFFALLALAWTAGALLAAELSRWAAGALASGDVLQAGRELANTPVPEWLAIWVDPGFVRLLQSGVLWMLEHGQAALPFMGTAAGWLVPLVWVAWGLGIALILALAVGAHWLIRRFLRRPA